MRKEFAPQPYLQPRLRVMKLREDATWQDLAKSVINGATQAARAESNLHHL